MPGIGLVKEKDGGFSKVNAVRHGQIYSVSGLSPPRGNLYNLPVAIIVQIARGYPDALLCCDGVQDLPSKTRSIAIAHPSSVNSACIPVRGSLPCIVQSRWPTAQDKMPRRKPNPVLGHICPLRKRPAA